MKRIDPIERLLGDSPRHLSWRGRTEKNSNSDCSQKRNPHSPGGSKMFTFLGRFSLLKVAAALAGLAVLIGSGWAAEKVYQKFTDVSVTLEESPKHEWTLPNGAKMTMGGTIGTTVKSDDPKAIEIAKRHHEEMKQLIAEKKYAFVSTFDADGQKQYVYSFTYADGKKSGMNFSMPLDNVASWDDYLQKQAATRRKIEQEQIYKAIAAGRFQLIDKGEYLIHICRDVESNQKYKVQRIGLTEGKEIALYRPFDTEAESKATAMPRSSWEDHLQAIRDGRQQLLGKETIPHYKYEIVLEDGSKTIFSYGGGEPLKKPEAK